MAVSLEGLDQWERATTDKYGWLTAEDLEADERPADPDIPGLIRAAVASVGREQARGIAGPALQVPDMGEPRSVEAREDTDCRGDASA